MDQGPNFIADVIEGVSEEHVRCACHKLQLSINNTLEVEMFITSTIVLPFEGVNMPLV